MRDTFAIHNITRTSYYLETSKGGWVGSALENVSIDLHRTDQQWPQSQVSSKTIILTIEAVKNEASLEVLSGEQ